MMGAFGRGVATLVATPRASSLREITEQSANLRANALE